MECGNVILAVAVFHLLSSQDLFILHQVAHCISFLVMPSFSLMEFGKPSCNVFQLNLFFVSTHSLHVLCGFQG